MTHRDSRRKKKKKKAPSFLYFPAELEMFQMNACADYEQEVKK